MTLETRHKHDLRHAAAQRMIDDPQLSLTDVQWVLGHAHLSATQIYLRPREDEIVARMLEHQHNRCDVPRPSLSLPHGTYQPELVGAENPIRVMRRACIRG
jgi:hypothetical protein